MIEAKNLFTSYGKKEVLKDVSLTFDKGLFTAIAGPNGCGKTTLLKTIMGITKIKSGCIFADCKNISLYSEKELSRKIAYLPQGRKIPDMTVKSLVLHGRFPHTNFTGIYKSSDHQAAFDAMEKLSLLPFADLTIASLSGGMRQNVFIAMALCQDTDYILLDEPTTYLDISNQIKLMMLLKKLAAEGKGIIAVLHDLPLALSFSDKIAVMEDGRITAYDTPEKVYASGVIKNVFGSEIKKSEAGKSFYFEFNPRGD